MSKNAFEIEGVNVPSETKKMSLYEALRLRETYRDKLKKLESSFRRAGAVVTYAGKNTKEIDGVSIDDVVNQLKSNYDTIVAVNRNISKLNEVINQANATTTVEIIGNTYTIVEAMAVKASLETQIAIYNRMASQVTDAYEHVESLNQKNLTQEKATKYATEYIKSLPDTYFERTDVDQKQFMQDLEDEYKEKNTLIVIDPYNLVDKLGSVREKLTEFKQSIETALTRTNLLTEVEVDLS